MNDGVGCRVPMQVLAVFASLLIGSSLLFFAADPSSIPFWRLWLFSAFAPVSGVAMSFGATGMAWTLDGAVWALVAVWVGRADGVARLRRRFLTALTLALVVGFVVAGAG